ncbi:MAG: hypothetical protein H5T34_06830 [Candidatus Methanomethyliales bacterium]|nr:hypothetical protein [Candidatus Methanomethylicales archaeon]
MSSKPMSLEFTVEKRPIPIYKFLFYVLVIVACPIIAYLAGDCLVEYYVVNFWNV